MRLTIAALAASLAIALSAPAFAAKKCNAHPNGQSVMGKCVAHQSDRDHGKGGRKAAETESGSEAPAE